MKIDSISSLPSDGDKTTAVAERVLIQSKSSQEDCVTHIDCIINKYSLCDLNHWFLWLKAHLWWGQCWRCWHKDTELRQSLASLLTATGEPTCQSSQPHQLTWKTHNSDIFKAKEMMKWHQKHLLNLLVNMFMFALKMGCFEWVCMWLWCFWNQPQVDTGGSAIFGTSASASEFLTLSHKHFFSQRVYGPWVEQRHLQEWGLLKYCVEKKKKRSFMLFQWYFFAALTPPSGSKKHHSTWDSMIHTNVYVVKEFESLCSCLLHRCQTIVSVLEGTKYWQFSVFSLLMGKFTDFQCGKAEWHFETDHLSLCVCGSENNSCCLNMLNANLP